MYLFFADLLQNWRPNPLIFSKILGFLGTITILHIAMMLCYIVTVFRIYYLVPRKTNTCVAVKKTVMVVCGIVVSVMVAFCGAKYEELKNVPDSTSLPNTFTWVVKACLDNVNLYLAELFMQNVVNLLVFITLWRICFMDEAPHFNTYMKNQK